MAKRRTENRKRKAQVKAHRMKNPGEASRYSRKRRWLQSNGGFGFEHLVKAWK